MRNLLPSHHDRPHTKFLTVPSDPRRLPRGDGPDLPSSICCATALNFVSYKDRRPVATALKGIYQGHRYPAIGQSWRRAWNEVVPFYAFHADVRRILYTTNAIEALNAYCAAP